jgi:excisionase family DNA binding protein
LKETKKKMDELLIIGLSEAAEMTGLSESKLKEYIRQGRLRAVRMGRRRLVMEPGELERLVERVRTEMSCEAQ